MQLNNIQEYHKNRHSCYLLQYHLVLVTKYRHPVIVQDLETYLVEYAKYSFNKAGCTILEVNANKDHIHILFEAPPQICLSTFINNFKTCSSRMIRKKFEEFLKPYYWKPVFWSRSYFIGTTSDRSTECVKKYIQNQKD